MATILLSAAGAALGAGFGGTILGLSGAVIGRAVGATVGRVIDQRLLGAGSEPVETGRVERFRLMGASEGTAIAQVWGRMRLPGQVIWATRFQENSASTGGGKGAPRPKSTSFSYSVSLAVALCEGEVTSVGRIWADGVEIAPGGLDLRVYLGSQTQLPDPKIEAVEGTGMAPAYRGIAYVVIENLDLSTFGNRVPQFSFEVMRRAQGAAVMSDLATAVRAVCLIPGTGEYALGTTPVHYSDGPGQNRSANVNSVSGLSDFATSLNQLRDELPDCGSVSLVVSWFGDDLRCGSCLVRPKAEQTALDGVGMPWTVSGLVRAAAQTVPQLEGRSVYGGTPADAAVIEAIQAIRLGGQKVMFYPFILMDQLAGNTLNDPWSGAASQPVLPWRGRITLSAAPGQPGSPDRSATAATEVADFFGTAQVADFSVSGTTVLYSGPTEWRYRRFVLHYAHLCLAAGGVDAFCIGSEMRSLTQIRGAMDVFPTVAALRQLAADVRSVLGPTTKISYAADWSEYFGYHIGAEVYFHLDPLWADPNIDFIGIDNYLPLSDWRDGEDHADAGWGAVYNLDYLKSNIAGGEGFDWYYGSTEGEVAQLRLPITDGANGEPWVYRAKDLVSWWSMAHHDRPGGVRSAAATDWVPMSKPIRFTEYGCAAVDKGSNQPNRFLDAKSSESGLPRASTGQRDDLIQMQYLRAMHDYWQNPANNPVSSSFGGPMVDFARCHVWAWDARPYPAFPRNAALWSDGENYDRGHWLNGRTAAQSLSGVIAEVCGRSLVADVDAAQAHGLVRGYSVAEIGSGRSALQPLLLAYGVDAVERDGILLFRNRTGQGAVALDPDRFVISADIDGAIETTRAADATLMGRVRVTYVEAEGDFVVRTAEAVFPDASAVVASDSELALLLTGAEARRMAERWLAEARVARDSARFALPKSSLALGAGDVVTLGPHRYRIDRIEQSDLHLVEAVRIEPASYQPGEDLAIVPYHRGSVAPVPVFPIFLDLPLLSGDEVEHSPHVAIFAQPWQGPVAIWSAPSDEGYAINRTVDARAAIGVTETSLDRAASGIWDRGGPLRVRMLAGELASATEFAVLNGANAVAIGDGTAGTWEVFQFADAQLVAPSVYELRMRLRGQSGSDGIMPAAWPAGSYVVVLDQAVRQIDLAASARGLSRFYRVGVASRGYDDAQVSVHQMGFDGVGLRPYSVAHLNAIGSIGQDISLTWTRRTRVDGDSWQSVEVPIGEDRESYLVRVLQGVTVIRGQTVSVPNWTYSTADQIADGIVAPFEIAVAQVSDRFGPGPVRSLVIA